MDQFSANPNVPKNSSVPGEGTGTTVDTTSSQFLPQYYNTELNKKLSIAQKMGNGHLCSQLRMALESYNSKYRDKLEENYKKQTQVNFDDKINIQ